MIKKNKCILCGKNILFSEKDYVIKEKHLMYDPRDKDPWAAYNKVHICKNCFDVIKNQICQKKREED